MSDSVENIELQEQVLPFKDATCPKSSAFWCCNTERYWAGVCLVLLSMIYHKTHRTVLFFVRWQEKLRDGLTVETIYFREPRRWWLWSRESTSLYRRTVRASSFIAMVFVRNHVLGHSTSCITVVRVCIAVTGGLVHLSLHSNSYWTDTILYYQVSLYLTGAATWNGDSRDLEA